MLCSLFILQGVLDLIPEALALDLVFVGRGLLELTQQLFLLVGEVLRDFDIDADILIAAAAAGRMRLRATAGCVVTVLRMAMRSSTVIVT